MKKIKEIELNEFGKLVFKYKINPNVFAERVYEWVDRIIVLDETGDIRRLIFDGLYSTFDFSDWEPMTKKEYALGKRMYKDFREKVKD